MNADFGLAEELAEPADGELALVNGLPRLSAPGCAMMLSTALFGAHRILLSPNSLRVTLTSDAR